MWSVDWDTTIFRTYVGVFKEGEVEESEWRKKKAECVGKLLGDGMRT